MTVVSREVESVQREAGLECSMHRVVLFHGEQRTGKTELACAVAESLGVDVFRIDLGRAGGHSVSEVAKNLPALFTAAERSGALLLIEEADALFSKRTGARSAAERYASERASWLLDRIGRYPRPVIVECRRPPRELEPDLMECVDAAVVFPRI